MKKMLILMVFVALFAQETTHVVKIDDTLWDIADIYYQNPFLWPYIWRANLTKIEDPHWIYPDQLFVIPPHPEGEVTEYIPERIMYPTPPSKTTAEVISFIEPDRRIFSEEIIHRAGFILEEDIPLWGKIIGTEPMAGFFSGVVVVLTLRLLYSSSIESKDIFLLIGFFLGLSILTKVTAILLIPPLVFFMMYTFFTKDISSERRVPIIFKRTIIVFGTAFIVSGWYYMNNWIEMGQFFIAGWDPSRNINWWQHPGYRTLGQFLTFGKSLFYPIYSSVLGIWDSLYSTLWMDGFLSGMDRFSHRPPWNYGFLLSSAWLSILPSALILFGILTVLRKPAWVFWQGLFFAAFCTIVYVSAICYLFLTIPIYSVGKASYTLGIIPCYAVLSAGGFEMLTRTKLARAIINGIIACWAVGVYAAYFVF